MKILTIIVHTLVLWAVVESRHVRRLERSLQIEDKGHNLTEKLQQEEIHKDVLQHFGLSHSSTQATPSEYFRADTLVLDDSNEQNLKNDENLRGLDDIKVSIDKEPSNRESEDEKNKSVKGKDNYVIGIKYNETEVTADKRSEIKISHPYELTTSTVLINEEEKNQQIKGDSYNREHHSDSSFTEPLKDSLEWKNVETKKKEKGKKEILEVATVPTDHYKFEKPLKDSVIGVKLKEKNKDTISEALDEQRSTIRINNSSSSSSFRLDGKENTNNHDNNTLGSLDIFKADSAIVNNEESVGQNVNSVINSNGVNSESFKTPRVKYSAAKRANNVANDTEAESSSASENQLVEEAARNTVPVLLNLEPQTTPTVLFDTTRSDKQINHKQVALHSHPKPTDSAPTKIDIFDRLASPSLTTVVKPSTAFKQQLASKLKGLDPSPTDLTPELDDSVEENLEKISGKLPTKASPKKKSKPDYYAPELHIPATATAWTLVSTSSEDLKSAQKPATPDDAYHSHPETTMSANKVRQTTISPITRVKSFVPWSTKLLIKSSSAKPSTTPLTEGMSELSTRSSVYETNKQNNYLENQLLSLENKSLSSTTEEQSVIRTTEELDRNMTETSINLIQSYLNDVMIRDQSSTKSNNIKATQLPTTQSVITTSSSLVLEITGDNISKTGFDNQPLEKENVIETKQISEVKDVPKVTDEITNEKIDNNTYNFDGTSKNASFNNEVSSRNANNNINGEKFPYIPVNESSNFVLTATSTTSVPEGEEHSKIKNTNEFSDLDAVLTDILGEGVDESKSLEEDEEDEKQKQTTTTIPIFDLFETTLMSDLEEEDDVDEKSEEELAILMDKPTHNHSRGEIEVNVTVSTSENQTKSEMTAPLTEMTNPSTTPITIIDVSPTADKVNLTTESPDKANTTEFMIELSTKINSTTHSKYLEQNLTTESPEVNSSNSYVTSFDIVSKGNTSVVVTKTPAEADINWYSVDTTKSASVPTEQTPIKIDIAITTITAPIETTNEPEMNEPEMTTVSNESQDDSTIVPETTITVISTSTSTTTVDPELPVEHEEKEDVYEEGEVDPRACVMAHVSFWKLCHDLQQLRESIALQFMSDVTWEQVIIFSHKLQECNMHDQQSSEDQPEEIKICFFNKRHEPSPILKDEFLRTKDASFIIMTPAPEGFDNVFAAIILSIIAAICLVLLGILLVIVRKRQGRFNYGQRCTPVSLDDYSLDNISVYNSVRRKGLRASKRSYGNPAFDDPGGPTHSINFAGLANFSSDRKALDEEFGQIPMITVKPDELPPGAESKNRYANVIPLPETRVPLQTKEGAETLDEYINANYIKGPKGQEKLYIACQAPLQSTVEDFWRMVWQQQSKVILMITALTENGVEKCADYLPQLEISDCHRVFGDFQVTLKNHEVREKYIISTLQLKNLETNLWREVTHLWYSSWPAQGVPEEGNSLIAFLIEARSYARGATGPTVVHCSPGTGRTGTVIAIDLCIRDFETLRSVDIPRTVYALRRDRAGAVQTKDQYAFIYQVLNVYATKLTGGGMDSI